MPVPVTLFFTCLADTFRPEIALSTVAVLERFDCRVTVPLSQTCCGQPPFNAGNRPEARAMAIRFLKRFAATEGYIVTPSGSCAAMVRHGYPALFRDEPIFLSKALDVGARTHELTSFLVDVLGVTDPKSDFKGVVAYHESCHLKRGMGVSAQPKSLLRAIPGVTLVDLAEADRCCGFGGLFSVKEPRISEAMVARKAECVVASGASIVTGGDYGCLMNIGGFLSRAGYPVAALHIAEILAGSAGTIPVPEAEETE